MKDKPFGFTNHDLARKCSVMAGIYEAMPANEKIDMSICSMCASGSLGAYNRAKRYPPFVREVGDYHHGLRFIINLFGLEEYRIHRKDYSESNANLIERFSKYLSFVKGFGHVSKIDLSSTEGIAGHSSLFYTGNHSRLLTAKQLVEFWREGEQQFTTKGEQQ